ncbi:neurogenic protein big brain-like [Gigantopelta aegis]|uniref:neurogenic protein big brain-like n=1 Tax=Gigantopelta aegis TaxID=1735272 RepID=UPI001B889B16|nr:neurogenic protein big brain-like [Gigantopelta aegis]
MTDGDDNDDDGDNDDDSDDDDDNEDDDSFACLLRFKHAVFGMITPAKCHKDLGITLPDEAMTIWQGLGLEILLTFLLVFTIFATVDKNRKEMGSKAFAIGLALTVCHLAGYRFTGSSMNPARSLGPAFVMNRWKFHWIYWAGPLIGAVFSCLLYEYIFDPSRGRRKLPVADTTPIYSHPTDDISSPIHSFPSGLTTPTYTNSSDHQYGNHVDNHLVDRPANMSSPNPGVNYGNYPIPDEDLGVGNTYAGQSLGRRHYSTCYMPVDTTNNGAENHAYSFDSHPRRIPPPPPPRMSRPPEFPPEEILLNDVRVDAYSKS